MMTKKVVNLEYNVCYICNKAFDSRAELKQHLFNDLKHRKSSSFYHKNNSEKKKIPEKKLLKFFNNSGPG